MSFEYRLFSAVSELDRIMAARWLHLAMYQELGENMEESI